jgi:hypothetical protein
VNVPSGTERADQHEAKETDMKTRIADLIVKTAAVAGLALTVAFANGFGGADAQQAESGNYFETQTVPAGARTGTDAHDPYAPVDLGTSGAGSLRLGGADLRGASGNDAAEDPCSPQRCAAW